MSGGSDPVLSTVVTPAPVVAQATAAGREIHRLTIWNGRLWIAYGDLDADDGPIHALSLALTDPATVLDPATLTTEETWAFRPFGSRMFVPFLDPRGGIGNPENGSYAVTTDPTTWATVANVTPYPEHIFDLIETADGLFLFGSSEHVDTSTYAAIWRSTDDGATWTAPVEVDPNGSGVARFFGAMSYPDGTIVATLYDTTGITDDTRTYLWPPGGPWTEITNAGLWFGDAVPFAHAGTDFHLCFGQGKGFGVALGHTAWCVRTLPADDAQRATVAATIPASPYDAKVTADGLSMYLLDSHFPQRVWRGDTAGAWSVVLSLATSDPKVVCMAVDEVGGWFYFGSTDSQVLRHAIPA